MGGQGLGRGVTFPRFMPFFFNIPGAAFVIGVALLSIWRFSRKREYSYRMWANVLIAVGAIIIAFVGSRARAGDTTGLYAAEMVASVLLLAGFLLAGTLQRGAKIVAKRRE